MVEGGDDLDVIPVPVPGFGAFGGGRSFEDGVEGEQMRKGLDLF